MMRRVMVPFLIILVISCKGGLKEKKGANENLTAISDMTMNYDGRLITGWEVTNFGPQGPVYVSDGAIVLGMGEGCTGITWKGNFPVVDYEVSLDAKRVNGNDFFCGMTFPVGKSPCTLIVGGWGGTTVGLSSINGQDASDNSTRRLMKFENNRWYNIRLEVTGTKISAWIDSLQVVDFTTGNSRLTIRPEVELSKPFGIASWNSTAALRNIKVTSLKIQKTIK
jgi:hypothetical protein